MTVQRVAEIGLSVAPPTSRQAVAPAPTWRVDEALSEAALADLAAGWDRLSERADSALLFNSAEWARACWRHFHARQPGARLWVLAVHDTERLHAVLPLWIDTRRWLGITTRTARLLGEGPSDYGDLLCSASSGEAIDALAAHLLGRQAAWDLLDCRETPPDSAMRSLLVPRLRAAGCAVEEADDSACRSIPTGEGWERYYCRHFNSKRRRDHRRDLRILETTGSVTHEWLVGEGPIAALSDEFATVQAAHALAGEHRPGEFNDPVFRPFLEHMMTVAARRGWLRLAVMRRDGDTLSYYVAFHYRGRYCVYNTAHRADAQQYSVGKLLMLFLLERLFDERGGLIDFMRGDEPYKETWTDDCATNRRIRITGASRGARMRRWLVVSAMPAVERHAPRLDRLLRLISERGWRGLAASVARRLGVGTAS